MSAKKVGVLWELEDHTKAKHSILVQYMRAWLPIMSFTSKRIKYIDAFAGPGEYLNGDPGSPVLFLNTVKETGANLRCQIKCLFVEKDPIKYEHLESVLAQYKSLKNLDIETRCGTCKEIITKILDTAEIRNLSLIPTFIFLDPFGYTEPSMDIIKRIMKHSRCEVFINFMYEEANRFLEIGHQAKHYDSLFGTSEWNTICSIDNSKLRKQLLHDLYKKQLTECANIKYVRSFEMKNKNNATKYYLFFGTNSIDGLKKMKEAMWKVDPYGSFTYSDFTNKDQLTLFKPEPDYFMLKDLIVNKFKGKIIRIEDIESYVIIDTPFRETHYKRQILKPMEIGEPSEIEVIYPQTRRRGSYPNGSKIRFI